MINRKLKCKFDVEKKKKKKKKKKYRPDYKRKSRDC